MKNRIKYFMHYFIFEIPYIARPLPLIFCKINQYIKDFIILRCIILCYISTNNDGVLKKYEEMRNKIKNVLLKQRVIIQMILMINT